MNDHNQLAPDEILQNMLNRREKARHDALLHLQIARELHDELEERIELMHDTPKSVTAICSICQCEYETLGHGNNAEPVNSGRCCDECDWLIVTPARIRIAERGHEFSNTSSRA